MCKPGLGRRVAFALMSALVSSAALIAQPSEEAEGWSVSFPSNPLMLSSSQPCPITLVCTNPKGAPKTAQVKVKFLTAGNTMVAQQAFSLSLLSGTANQTLTMDAAIVAQAKASGAVNARALLIVGGAPKATARVPADFDISVTATANPTTGEQPLDVAFSGEVSGGRPPYAFGWDFGDGGASAEQNPTHTYSSAGAFTATLVVTDSIGGRMPAAGISVTTMDAETQSRMYVARWLPKNDAGFYLANHEIRAMILGSPGNSSYRMEVARLLLTASPPPPWTQQGMEDELAKWADGRLLAGTDDLYHGFDPCLWNSQNAVRFYFEPTGTNSTEFKMASGSLQEFYALVKYDFLWRYVMNHPSFYGGKCGGYPDQDFNPTWNTQDPN